MYYPYFRGKQFELIVIRENAEFLARSGFVPVIEPVREVLGGLEKALDAVCEAGGKAVVIVNPRYGEYSLNGTEIADMLYRKYGNEESISAGILLKEDMSHKNVLGLCSRYEGASPTFVHAGYTEAKELAEHLNSTFPGSVNVFIERACGKIYRRHFSGSGRVLLRDGFERRRNADYPPREKFSDLHVTFKEEGMDGFGDFLIVGDEYRETGGPAYAVAIHLTYIDRRRDGEMFMHHFVSATRDTPTDPAGKFGEALGDLIRTLDSGKSGLLETSAVGEFRRLHKGGHFPGLGYVKKLSMLHHIETMADYLGS